LVPFTLVALANSGTRVKPLSDNAAACPVVHTNCQNCAGEIWVRLLPGLLFWNGNFEIPWDRFWEIVKGVEK
jgi:hypothetical protein